MSADPVLPDIAADFNHLSRSAFAMYRRTVRKSLYFFLKEAWPIVEPNVPFIDNWHIFEICRVLEAVSRGELHRVIINIPPGCMKSLIVSVMWPTWFWGQKLGLRTLTASYSKHLSMRDNLRARQILDSQWYKLMFPEFQLSPRERARGLFRSAEKGWRFATSTGGAGTGEHPDVIVVDDPLTAHQARSETERRGCIDWFDQTISTRGKVRDVSIVVIMQRLHMGDLSGHLLDRGGWFHVMFPMRYDPKRRSPLDHRVVPGALLWPEMLNKQKVTELELDLGPFGVAGQMDQNPVPKGGGLFKEAWFKYVDEAPSYGIVGRGWDTAATEDGGDWTVGVKMRYVLYDPSGEKVGPLYYIEDVKRGQWSPAHTDIIFRSTAISDGKECRQVEEKEPGSSGKVVIDARARLLNGYDYHGVAVSMDKQTRARPFRAQVEAGNVFLVRGHWNQEYVRELAQFPVGIHDDQVDGTSCIFNDLHSGRPPKPIDHTLG